MANQIQKMTTDKILEFIDKEVESGRRMDIETIEAFSGYSRRHLQRLFFAETGISLGEYIRRRRLNRAALLLRFSRRSFQDIALSLGFDSQQSFNREFKKNTGFTPRQYRDQPDWVLFPLLGRIRKMYDIPPPEKVTLPGGTIVGDELIFYGTVGTMPENASFQAYLERIFSAQAHRERELWMVVSIIPVEDCEYHYQVNCGLGQPGRKTGRVFSYNSGEYLKFTFETTRETHVGKTHHIYLNMLSGSNAVRREGSEVLVFVYAKGKVACTLYIPVV